MPTLPLLRLTARCGATIAIGATLAVAGAVSMPAVASANSTQIAMIQDNLDLTNPDAAFSQFRELGANTVRVIVPWSQIAPSPNARTKPKFTATDPNAYPASTDSHPGWAPYDAIVREAAKYNLRVDLTVTGGAPRWAEGGTPPTQDPYFAWKPNAAAYGQFMQAVGTRYDGHFTPAGQSQPLPAVHFWAIFNEPNFGEDLGPQAIDGSRLSVGPMMYRSLVQTGYKALQVSGHRRDTILIGEFAARGIDGRPTRRAPQGYPGNYGQTKPLEFIRTLYCVDSSYRELRGSYAKARGCPTNAAGSRRFRAQNPALFNATGIADHPYPDNGSPVNDGRNPNFAAFPDLGNLGRVLDRVNRIYGSRRQLPIYNTEYGYITHPPANPHYVSQATAAWYINWAEYLSYKSARVRSYMQYLLTDPQATAGPYAGFASGLEMPDGAKKATFYAWRMPLYMPRTNVARNSSVEVWGDVRPAPFASLDGFGTQKAQIQLNGKTINTVTINKPGGYFDIHMRFSSSGTVRLAWTYPSADSLLSSPDVQGQTIYSRSFGVKVH